MLDNIVLNGSGAGQPLGILNSSCLYTVAKEGSQTAGTILWKNVQKMFTRLWSASRDSKSLRWFINPEATEQILDLNQVIGSGGSSVIMAAGEGVRPIPKTLLGIPIVWTSQASALGAVGDIILADMNSVRIKAPRQHDVVVYNERDAVATADPAYFGRFLQRSRGKGFVSVLYDSGARHYGNLHLFNRR